MTHHPATQVVVVHGTADHTTEQALRTAGLHVATRIGDTTVWTAPPGSDGDPVAGPTPGPPSRVLSPLLLSVPEAAAALGVGRTTAYELIANGHLETVHLGRATRVPLSALDTLVEKLRRPTKPSLRAGNLKGVDQVDVSQPPAAYQPRSS